MLFYKTIYQELSKKGLPRVLINYICDYVVGRPLSGIKVKLRFARLRISLLKFRCAAYFPGVDYFNTVVDRMITIDCKQTCKCAFQHSILGFYHEQRLSNHLSFYDAKGKKLATVINIFE